MIKWDLLLEHKGNGSTYTNPINVIHNINKIKIENCMIILIDSRKAFDKIQQPFMIRKITLNKLDTDGIYLNIVKAVYYKSTAKIMLSVENLKAFPL